MRELTSATLPTRCRICLKKLKKKNNVIYNVHLVPNLSHLLLSYLLVDVNDDDDFYPKNLCQKCYDRLQDIITFRNLACKTAIVLSKIFNDDLPPPSKSLTPPTNTLETPSKSLISANVMTFSAVKDPTQEPVDVIPKKRISLKSTAVITPAPIMENNPGKNKRHQLKGQDDDDQLILPSLKQPKLEPTIENEIEYIKTEIDTESFEESSAYVDIVNVTYSDNSNECDITTEFDRSYTNPDIFSLFKKTNIVKNEAEDIKTEFDVEPLEPSSIYGDVDNATYADNSNVHDVTTELDRSDTNLDVDIVVKTEPMLTEQNPSWESECNSTDAEKQPIAIVEPEIPVSTNGLAIPFNEMKPINSITPAEPHHVCPKCNRKLKNKQTFRQHLKRHDAKRKHVCQICGTAKITHNELKIHMQKHNPNAPKYKCPHCPKFLKRKHDVKKHIRTIHDSIRLYACGICSQSFITPTAKIEHERLHSGEKPYACEYCEMRFASRKGINSHRQTHDFSLRRFVCKYCSHRCITRENLKKHEVRHVQDLPHRCNVCGLGYVQPKVMLRHQATHTPAEVAAAKAKKGKEDKATV